MDCSPPGSSVHGILQAAPHSTCDVSSQNRVRTCAPLRWKHRVITTGPPRPRRPHSLLFLLTRGPSRSTSPEVFMWSQTQTSAVRRKTCGGLLESVFEATLHGPGASKSRFIFKVSTRKTHPLGQQKPPEPQQPPPAPPTAALPDSAA